MKRRESIEVNIGHVGVGGSNPIVIQSMTNTDTADIESSVAQVKELADAGSELVRLTVNVDAAAQAIPEIKKRLLDLGCDVPLIGDFHYNGHTLLTKYPECAKTLDKYRINPGNVGFGNAQDRNFKQMLDVAKEFQKPIRIGVNWGSLDQALLVRLMDENTNKPEAEQKSADEIMIDAMVQSAVQSTESAIAYGVAENKIIVSLKISKVTAVVDAYQTYAPLSNLPLHVGLTEAGMGVKGAVSTSAALSILLNQGIGDTIRVSLTPRPGASRTEEVEVAKILLQSMNYRQFSPQVTSCPGCGRTTNTLFQEMTIDMEHFFKEKMPEWKQKGYKGMEQMQIAVMGCIVNGPGESKHANIGISLPGNGENPKAPVFVDGEKVATLEGPQMMTQFKQMVEDYVERKYS
ncbi:MAG: 4-hydroxy-3-methylbut-2-en-1-yl diphosphate synthase [Deltaproteobacteria bacterium CG_4_10_14_0_2_um_filter_43_8]|nr:MAG: 4-hydroxy-3-methylbut-2-en-1-yl diphosphate synthase [Deltaproteobacteria bacterium CG11_big_fil_rev_8_21_14_0_20_42_23]PJA18141.1 MAG: 4-hydroxy-3-methylbut-2-en-1-yl diphosphate synthase [Deltaproteobacteria bacterium CG_4_10_14_0_2_um_filter_43_8]PJC65205.1 MAG: 4-hydroxy-3-methylbut-2-en-1-yl diphosphate synthase [Deltaproteobacteria bacterium CG_4_9_14_0_2_um_filter_42_21]